MSTKGIIIPGTDKGIIQALITEYGFSIQEISQETGMQVEEIHEIYQGKASFTKSTNFSLLCLYLKEYLAIHLKDFADTIENGQAAKININIFINMHPAQSTAWH